MRNSSPKSHWSLRVLSLFKWIISSSISFTLTSNIILTFTTLDGQYFGGFEQFEYAKEDGAHRCSMRFRSGDCGRNKPYFHEFRGVLRIIVAYFHQQLATLNPLIWPYTETNWTNARLRKTRSLGYTVLHRL